MEILVSDKGIRDLVVHASGVVLSGQWNAKQAIIDALLLEVESNGRLDKSNDQECLNFAEHILSEIKNMSKRMTSGAGKRQQRYSPKLIGMCMAQQSI